MFIVLILCIVPTALRLSSCYHYKIHFPNIHIGPYWLEINMCVANMINNITQFKTVGNNYRGLNKTGIRSKFMYSTQIHISQWESISLICHLSICNQLSNFFTHLDVSTTQKIARSISEVRPLHDMWSNSKKWNESGFRPPLCTYRLNWARRTSWGWWDDWD